MSKQSKPIHPSFNLKPAGQGYLFKQPQLSGVMNHNCKIVVRCQSRPVFSDHPLKQGYRVVKTCFTKLNRLFNPRNGKGIGISSLRADRLDDELVELLKAGGYRTMTVASDA